MKIQKFLCFAAGLSLVFFSYWLGSRNSASKDVSKKEHTAWGHDDIIVEKPSTSNNVADVLALRDEFRKKAAEPYSHNLSVQERLDFIADEMNLKEQIRQIQDKMSPEEIQATTDLLENMESKSKPASTGSMYIFQDGSSADPQLLMDERYGSYKVPIDPTDLSKGWGPTVIVPRTSPQELFEAGRQRAVAKVARYNAQQKELALKQRQDELWYQRDQEDKRLSVEREIAREKAETALEIAREQSRRPPPVTIIRTDPYYHRWRKWYDYDY